MNQSATAVVAASVTATAALVSALVTNAVAVRNETRRRRDAAIDTHRQSLRAQAAEVFVHMFHLQHEMEWLTWHAAKRPEDLTPGAVTEYESAVHAVYPRILGAMAVLASLDLDIYQRLQPLVHRLYEVEGQIGEHLTGLLSPKTRSTSLTALGDYFKIANAFYLDLPPLLAEIMRDANHQ
jgi:hypothetical protein